MLFQKPPDPKKRRSAPALIPNQKSKFWVPNFGPDFSPKFRKSPFASARRDELDPVVVHSGSRAEGWRFDFGHRRLHWFWKIMISICLFGYDLTIRKLEHTYHGRVGSRRRTAGRRGEAGPGRTGRRRVGSPRRQQSPATAKASDAHVLNDFSEARTSEILSKQEKQKKAV